MSPKWAVSLRRPANGSEMLVRGDMGDANGPVSACGRAVTYRISIVVAIAVLVALAAFQFGRTRSNEAETEDGGESEFYSELGIVGAITATARAGGALDPTALVTPTSEPTATVGSELQPTSTPVEPTPVPLPPQLRVSSDEVAPGETFDLDVDGAEPGELFEVTMNGGAPLATATADENGSAKIELTVPEDEEPGNASVRFSGAESASTSVPITVYLDIPEALVEPRESPAGESVTVSGRKFEPSESVSISVDGELIGSAIAGSDGSLSVTTQLPEELEEGEHDVELEGSLGSRASAPVNIVPEPLTGAGADVTATIGPVQSPPAGTPAATTGAPTAAASPSPVATTDPTTLAGQSGAIPESSDGLGGPTDDGGLSFETWVYVAMAALSGWLLALTLLIIRRKEVTAKQLAKELADEIAERQRKIKTQGDVRSKSDDLDEAA